MNAQADAHAQVASGWAWQIRSAWQQSVAGIFECGRLLIEAKDVLPHGEFGAMCERELPFSDRTARMLMTIASDERLMSLNRNHGSDLPASWRTLYEITKLNDGQLKGLVVRRELRPDIERKAIVAARRDVSPNASKRRAASNATAPRDLEAKRIVAALKKFQQSDLTDPSWFAGQLHFHASRLNPLKWKLSMNAPPHVKRAARVAPEAARETAVGEAKDSINPPPSRTGAS